MARKYLWLAWTGRLRGLGEWQRHPRWAAPNTHRSRVRLDFRPPPPLLAAGALPASCKLPPSVCRCWPQSPARLPRTGPGTSRFGPAAPGASVSNLPWPRRTRQGRLQRSAGRRPCAERSFRVPSGGAGACRSLPGRDLRPIRMSRPPTGRPPGPALSGPFVASPLPISAWPGNRGARPSRPRPVTIPGLRDKGAPRSRSEPRIRLPALIAEPPRHRREPAARVPDRTSISFTPQRGDLLAGSARRHEASRSQPWSPGNSALPSGARSSGASDRWGVARSDDPPRVPPHHSTLAMPWSHPRMNQR
jgi:hypothetical protein